MSGTLRLGVNIDHVATIRNARGGSHPEPTRVPAWSETLPSAVGVGPPRQYISW